MEFSVLFQVFLPLAQLFSFLGQQTSPCRRLHAPTCPHQQPTAVQRLWRSEAIDSSWAAACRWSFAVMRGDTGGPRAAPAFISRLSGGNRHASLLKLNQHVALANGGEQQASLSWLQQWPAEQVAAVYATLNSQRQPISSIIYVSVSMTKTLGLKTDQITLN